MTLWLNLMENADWKKIHVLRRCKEEYSEYWCQRTEIDRVCLYQSVWSRSEQQLCGKVQAITL